MATGVHHIAGNVQPVPAENGSSQAPAATNESRKPFHLGSFAIDEDRPMRVAIIGAGFSGIIAGIRIAQKVRNVELVIYEREAGVGGTWLVSKYPGLKCDVPAPCYQITFEPNPQWSAFYAPGPEIRAYLERVVEKYKLMQYIKLNHNITSTRWDAGAGKWNLAVSTPNGDIHDAVDVLLSCTGSLARWDWPKIDGLFDLKGRVVHSAQWDLEGEEAWAGKTVAVIGAGSSALQLVPSLQPKAAKVVNFVRSKTWISMRFGEREIQERNPGGYNHHYTEKELREFADPKYYAEFRHKLEHESNSVHGITVRGHPIQQWAIKDFTETMTKKLAKKPWIADHIIPDFPVTCRRITPGPGYLEALTEDNVDFVPEEIKRVTPSGIETVDGKHRDFDIIVCATGYDTSYKPRFAIVGRDGIDLRDKWAPHPVTYLGIATDGFPNMFQTLGPNTGVGAGNLLIHTERQIDYIVEAILKLQRERLKSLEPKREAVMDYDEYLEHYFPTTVHTDKCPSWYKMGEEQGRIVALWPGSCLHTLRALEHPRWEDYNYEQLDDTHNRFHWFGNGWTANERDDSGDRAWYLKEIDYPPVPE